ncbi:hypothetical protein QCA50_011043 [Cerrena zonata]|uniref:Uncharacterized protein n=1 Tax=Cerrena zonata TaxID=2478898 RepID=A0AAW0G303_9APHY
MLPPQSLPLRPPVSPASSTASDYFADLGSSTKTPGPFRPVTGPSRVPQNEVQDPSAQARPRVVGGARRVLLPDPSVAPKDAPEASTSKPPVRPGPSRATTAPATTQASRPPVSSSTTTATTAKVAPKPPVRSRTESIVRPKVLSSSTTTNTAKTSTTTISRPAKPDAGVPVRSRTISRLTEPTQAQLARAKATTRPPVAAKNEVAKPFVPSRTAAKSTSAVKAVPVEKDRKKKPASAIVTVKKGREKTPAPEIVTEPEKVVEVAKMVPLPPSPQGEALAFPSVSPEPPVVEEYEQVTDTKQGDAASEDEVIESAPEIETEAETETETETEGEKDVNIQSETEEPESELEEDATPTQPISPPQESEENVDEPNKDDEELDEDTLREAMDTPQDLPQFFLQPESNPSTPQARPLKSHSQLVPETPISALLASIQMGFDLSPAPSYDADQTMTFGGLLPRDRAQCEPLFLGDRRRR